jgi:hypothetical protein
MLAQLLPTLSKLSQLEPSSDPSVLEDVITKRVNEGQ